MLKSHNTPATYEFLHQNIRNLFGLALYFYKLAKPIPWARDIPSTILTH